MGVVSAVTQEYGPDLGVAPDKVDSIVIKVIDLVVRFLNKVGIFKKVSGKE